MSFVLAGSALYLAIALRDWGNGYRETATFLALFALQFAIVYFAAGRIDERAMIVGALAFRVALLAAGFHDGAWQRFLLYDSDIWRYLWDGHVTRSGINPYSFAPAAPELDGLAESPGWGQIRDSVNYDGIPTIYPPLAQAVFALTPGNALAMKLVVTGFDLLALYWLIQTLRLQNRPATDALWYAWNPLVIKVFAGSGHIDSLTVAALAAMFRYSGDPRRELSAWAMAVLSKWSPLALLPWMATRHGARILWPLVPLLAVAAIPGVFEGAAAFGAFWRFNAWLPQLGPLKMLAAAALALYWGAQGRKRIGEGDLECFARHTGYIMGAVIVLSPAVMPWYVTWLLPGAIVARSTVWIAFSGFVFAAFAVMADGREREWVLAIEYGALIVWLWRDYRNARSTDTGISPFGGRSR